jgi:hypothetical protein
MNELIEYFKKIESRLAALEQAQQAKSDAENNAMLEELETISEQVSALLTSLTNIQEQLATYQEAQAELESRMDELESRAEFDLPDDDGYDEDDEPEQTPAEPVVVPTVEPEPEEDLLPLVEEEPEPEPEPEPEVPHTIVPKVTDIKKAISLGDRFLFQRELFGGNGEQMAKTIADLNRLGSLEEAEAYIDKRFPRWDKESSTYELFFNILKRRW